MRTEEHLTGITADFIIIHSVTRISAAPITEYLNEHDTCFLLTV